MNLPQPLNEAFVEQIQNEFANSLRYEQLASFFISIGLDNISAYFRKHADEERGHAHKFIKHVDDRIGGVVVYQEIPAPSEDIKSPEHAADIYVRAEERTTNSIESLYALANELGSFVDLPFLLKMLEEQVEEEDSAFTFSLNIKATKDLVLFDKTFE